MARPIASIILVTYCPNEERKALSIKSFETLHKTGLERKDYELIVINNGGIHQELIDSLEPNIEIKNRVNTIFPAIGKNQGMRLARGEYVSFVDDDLLFSEGWLKEGIDMLEKYPNEKLVASVRYLGHPQRYSMGKLDNHLLVSKVGGWWILKKEIMDRYGDFKVGISEDKNYWKKNFKPNGYRFILSEKPYILHLGERKSILMGQFYEKHNKRF